MRLFFAVLACLSSISVAAHEPIPYELAFDRRELALARTSEMSPDGRLVAHEIRHSPESHSDGAASIDAYRERGVPPFAIGNLIFVSDVRTRRVTQVCPDAGNVWRPSWSPDSRSIAFFSDKSGVATLWVFDRMTARCRQVNAAPVRTELYVGDGAQWSPDGKTLYLVFREDADRAGESVAKSVADNASEPKVDVYYSGSEARAVAEGQEKKVASRKNNSAYVGAVDVANGQIRTLVPSSAKPMLIRLSASGNWLSYVSVPEMPDPTVYRSVVSLAAIPTSGGQIRVVADGVEMPTIMMASTLMYNWHPKEERLVFFKDKRVWSVELQANGPEAPAQLAPELGDLAFDVFWFTRDGRSLIVGTDPDPKAGADMVEGHAGGFAAIALDSGKARRLSFDTTRWSYEDILKGDARTVWQPDGESITVRLRERSTGGCAIVRINLLSGRSTVLWQGLAEMGGRAGTWTSGGNQGYIVGTYEDYSTPRDIYRFPADFSRKERLSIVEPRLEGISMGKVEVFETLVPLHDGSLEKTVASVLLPPGPRRGDRLPAIVMFYPNFDLTAYSGRHFGGGIGAFVEPPLLFTSRGYAVLFTHVKVGPEGRPGNPIKEMVDTLLPQVYHAAQLGYIDAGRLALRGNSYGGYGTVAIVSQTNLFRAGVPSSGFYDLGARYGGFHEGSSGSVAYFENGQGRMGEPLWTNILRYIENSPYYRSDKIVTPILLVQGGDDSVEETGRLFAALRRLNRPAQLAIYAGQGHAIPNWSKASAIDASRRIVDFYRRHLGNPTISSEFGTATGAHP